ncbi:hypothetical protein C8Q75DRAFT_803107 [Abortiporus biennis]|nr:hypothetical protein C8Q75DRAFT_803107 [Abortiporus biennis]
MPILSPLEFFGRSENQFHDTEEHSDNCFQEQSHICDTSDPLIRKVESLCRGASFIGVKAFWIMLASCRLFSVHFPDFSSSDTVTRQSTVLFDKYVKPALWFQQQFIDEISGRHAPVHIEVLPPSSEGVIAEIGIYNRVTDEEEEGEFTLEEAHCLILFISPGAVCWRDFWTKKKSLYCQTNSDIVDLLQQTIPQKARSVLITDEYHAVFVGEADWAICYHHYCLSRGVPLLFLIGLIIHKVSRALAWEPRQFSLQVQGALNQCPVPGALISPPSAKRPTSFRDFDLFTLQRSLPDLKKFLEWKREENARLESNPLQVGSTLRVNVNAFADEVFPWHSSFSSSPISEESRQFVTRCPRLRNQQVDDILSSGDSLVSFRITRIIPHDSDSLSRVFFGVHVDDNGHESTPICLKLLLECLFPIDEEDLFRRYHNEYPSKDPAKRLSSLHFADDMLRREQFAYERLKEFQGTLIPHCYAFHSFSLEDETKAYGVLLEIIPGTTIGKAMVKDWSVDRQAGLILVPTGSEYDPEKDSLVLIDFAFSDPRLGDEQAHKVMASFNGNTWGGHSEMLYGLGVPDDVWKREWAPLELLEI